MIANIQEEETWRLRSHDLWLKVGDRNTKFFHNKAKMRLNQNNIKEIQDIIGDKIKGIVMEFEKRHITITNISTLSRGH